MDLVPAPFCLVSLIDLGTWMGPVELGYLALAARLSKHAYNVMKVPITSPNNLSLQEHVQAMIRMKTFDCVIILNTACSTI